MLPLLVTMAGQFSTIEALCNTWYGENGSNPIIDCPANIRGNSIKIKRLTKEGKTRQLRICEILVKGYPGSYNRFIKKYVGNDHEMALSERNSHATNGRVGGKN